MAELIKYLDIPDEANVFVVGDIHGCYSKLIDELRKVYFDFDKDILLGVGDLVDRGPENEECMNLINQPWFHTVRGNHEDFCIQGADEYDIEIYHKMTNNGGEWFYKYPVEERLKIANFLDQLPYMMEVSYRGKKFGFVHADLPLEDWDVLKIMLEKNDEWENRNIRDHLVWARRLVNYNWANIANVDYVFLGHTVLNQPKHVGNAIFIDTGAVFGMKFTVLDLKEFVKDDR